MDFDSMLGQAWDRHAADPQGVAAELADALFAQLTEDARIVPFAHLSQHVYGEHLARWADGIALLDRIAALPLAGDASRQALRRFRAGLALAGGLDDERAGLAAGERLRITALAASHLAPHDAARAGERLDEAAALAEGAGLPDADPGHRALAIAGNNIAATLEEKAARSDTERTLMLCAAQLARVWWARAGSWLETERAEYRLAKSWLAAGDLPQARDHAQQCLEIVRANGDVALEAFFGWDALAAVERAAGNATGHTQALAQAEAAFTRLDEADQGWCRASLEALRAPA
jgi:hypothetical protein